MNIFDKLGKRNIILISVAVVALVVLIILLVADIDKPKSYYQDGYGVRVSDGDNGSLNITIEGGDTKDVPWVYQDEEENAPVVYCKANSGSGGKISIKVTPQKTGYHTICVKKDRVINDISFNIATVYIDVVVAEKGKDLVAKIAAVNETASDGQVGAIDTETPYYIKDNCIYLPANGDWDLYNADLVKASSTDTDSASESESDNAEAFDEDISVGVDDKGSYYYKIDYLSEDKPKNLILESESLNRQIKLVARLGEDGKVIIEKAKEK